MFVVIIVKQDMCNQVTKYLQLRNIYSYDCLHNVMIKHTLLLTRVILWPAIFLARQNLLYACLCVSMCECMSVYHWYIYVWRFDS